MLGNKLSRDQTKILRRHYKKVDHKSGGYWTPRKYRSYKETEKEFKEAQNITQDPWEDEDEPYAPLCFDCGAISTALAPSLDDSCCEDWCCWHCHGQRMKKTML